MFYPYFFNIFKNGEEVPFPIASTKIYISASLHALAVHLPLPVACTCSLLLFFFFVEPFQNQPYTKARGGQREESTREKKALFLAVPRRSLSLSPFYFRASAEDKPDYCKNIRSRKTFFFFKQKIET